MTNTPLAMSVSSERDMNTEELYETLLIQAASNRDSFKNTTSEKGQRMYHAFHALHENVDFLIPKLGKMRDICPMYDFHPVTANGYRSFIIFCDKFASLAYKICNDVEKSRKSFFKSSSVKNVECIAQIFASLNVAFDIIEILHECAADSGNLFLNDKSKTLEMIDLFNKVNLYPFYGRFVGSQFCESIRTITKNITILMATFSVYYFKGKRIISQSARFLVDPEYRANQLIRVISIRNVSGKFCKAFWNLSEMELFKMSIYKSSHPVNQLLVLQPEPLKYGQVDIPVPMAHIGPQPLAVRLVSCMKREGMTVNGKKLEPPSDHLIFHVHGGGFICQTSASHQPYLDDWATNIAGPLLSVDYSLAPEAPFPRAVEEVFYAYVWAINNAHKLGTTAKKIVIVGDSAGGNLCMSLVLKCLEYGVRKPDAVIPIYSPVLLALCPTPSRVMLLFDPMIPLGFINACVSAYTSPPPEEDLETVKTAELLTKIVSNPPKDTKENESNTSGQISEDGSVRLSDEILDKMTKDVVSRIDSLPLEGEIGTIEQEQELGEIVDKWMEDKMFDKFLSPFMADDEMLRQFPPIIMITTEMDPFLDDSVMMCRKLSSLGCTASLEVLSGVPHGFLNLILMSKEADEAAKFCCEKLKSSLEG